jgi:hypothetical protein
MLLVLPEIQTPHVKIGQGTFYFIVISSQGVNHDHS